MSFTRRLRCRRPWDGPAIFEFLRRRAIPGVESVSESGYRRTVALGRHQGELRVELPSDGHGVEIECTLPEDHADEVTARVKRIFDLEADAASICSVLGEDPFLAAVVGESPGARVPGCWGGFELMVRAVVGQQITVAGAATLLGRIALEHGGESAGGRLFPRAESLAENDLDGLGLTRARADTLRLVAREVASGTLVPEPGSDPEEFCARFTDLRGIGDWTAQYVAMRALRAPDAFPAGDLVLRQVAAEGGELPTASRLARRSQAWRPWRAYAAIYLWRLAASAR